MHALLIFAKLIKGGRVMDSKWKVYFYDFIMAVVMGASSAWITLKLLSVI